MKLLILLFINLAMEAEIVHQAPTEVCPAREQAQMILQLYAAGNREDGIGVVYCEDLKALRRFEQRDKGTIHVF